jgi:HSP20 family protein
MQMHTLERWSPLRDLDQVERRMRRFFDEIGLAPPLMPAADIYDAGNELVVELEVPGFDEKELEIQVTDHMLLVKGERATETDKKARTMRLHERLSTQFERKFELPPDIDSTKVHATYDKGVLTLMAPRSSEASRKVEIATH